MQIDDANAHIYGYDNLYQLTSVNYNDGNSSSYTYDALGNRKDVNESGSIIVYDTNNLNQYSAVGPQGSQVNYYYDKNGNLADDGIYLYYYDIENRLLDVNNKSTGNPIASYEYDYQGRRVRKTVYGSPNVITKYCYDGDQVIAECNESGALLRKFIYGPGIDEPICMIAVNGETETVYYYHFDGLGSVVALSDPNAEIVEQYSYGVFGEPDATSAIDNPYMFTGRSYDSETGLYYYRARYYDFANGRFLGPDPIGYKGGLNLYAYVRNNPLKYRDPFGLEVKLLRGTYFELSVGAGYVWLGIDDEHNEDVLQETLWGKRKVVVDITHERNEITVTRIYKPTGFRYIQWNPDYSTISLNKERISSSTGLYHEFCHEIYPTLTEMELIRQHENPLSLALGEDARTTHEAFDYHSISPISIEPLDQKEYLGILEMIENINKERQSSKSCP